MDMTAENTVAIDDIYRRAHAMRITPRKLAERAGIAYTTLWRARKDASKASVDTLRKLEETLDSIEADITIAARKAAVSA